MKRGFKMFLVAVLCLVTAFPLFACFKLPDVGGDGGGVGDTIIDRDRTQLFVHSHSGGFGTDWLNALITRFEEAHKDDVWETGKKGVQVFPSASKEAVMASSILENREEVYFSEYAFYYDLKNKGLTLDITGAITESLQTLGDSRSIADKLTAEQRGYYGIQENGAVHYYGIPHYAGYNSLTYNVDLFDERGYYFADAPANGSPFVSKTNSKKAKGPDGAYDTYDDGLPVTYDEFFELCERIADDTNTPVTWAGAAYDTYLPLLAETLCVDHDGLEQSMLWYTHNGSATTLATVQGGQLVRDASPTAITTDNAYELGRQEGRYYASQFIEKLMRTDKYHNSLAYNSAFTHMNAQEDFLLAGIDGVTNPIAMLVDGCWWEMEAKDTFRKMVQLYGQDYAKQNRNFGFLPLPKATNAKAAETAAADKKLTLYDSLYSLSFIKANIAEWKKPLALEFMRFANTDESLREFTSVTNTFKALEYDLTAGDLAKMTPYGRSLVAAVSKADIVYPYSQNSKFLNNSGYFNGLGMFNSRIGTYNYSSMIPAFRSTVTLNDYFTGIKTYFQATWPDLK